MSRCERGNECGFTHLKESDLVKLSQSDRSSLFAARARLSKRFGPPQLPDNPKSLADVPFCNANSQFCKGGAGGLAPHSRAACHVYAYCPQCDTHDHMGIECTKKPLCRGCRAANKQHNHPEADCKAAWEKPHRISWLSVPA